MAHRIEKIVVDDLDRWSAADETIRFALDGTEYEIDFSERDAADFRSTLNIYVGAARRVSGRRLKTG